ncbi:MAG: choice-of-anchor Q domain-containing protein, partial [Limisphaerales bacterium]
STNANQAAWGAGVYCYGGMVRDCVISNNVCSAENTYGGGVVLTGGQLRNSRVSANSGIALNGAAGGGVYATIMQLSEPSLVDACVIANNSVSATDTWAYTAASANGGGLNIGNGTTVRNTLINGNTAKATAGFTSGAGVWTSGSTLENCTIAYNRATTQNGNLGAGGGVTWGYNDQCFNNIIWFNSADNGPDNWEVNPFSYPTFVNSDIGAFFPAANTRNCIAADPLFVNTAQGDFRLQAGSPCVHGGTNQAWMADTVDLAGNSRISGVAVDLGAYEYLSTVSAPMLGSLSRPSESQCQFLINTIAGQNYTLQYSLSLTNWISLLLTNSPGGVLQITDTSATNASRFYRILVGP